MSYSRFKLGGFFQGREIARSRTVSNFRIVIAGVGSRGKLMALLCGFLMLASLQALAAAPVNIPMKALVLSATGDTPTGSDPAFKAITTFLDYVGIPYDRMIANEQMLVEGSLRDSKNNPKYQAIILSNDRLLYHDAATNSWPSAFTDAEWLILQKYEADFKIRQVTYYTFPSAEYGLTPPTGLEVVEVAYPVTLTANGQQVFPYLKQDAKIPIRYAWVWLSDALPNQPGSTTVTLVQDKAGKDIVTIHTSPDGRQNLAVTCDNSEILLHSQLMSYGIINWAMRGVHLGERSVFLMAHIDDIFMPNELFDTATNTLSETLSYRINKKDMETVEKWQEEVRKQKVPDFKDFALVMVFNGEGATADGLPGGKPNTKDALVQYFKGKEQKYQWVNHTFSHPDLNAATNSADVIADLNANHAIALLLKLTNYVKQNLVTGDVSGLGNDYAMEGIKKFGVTQIVSNTSVAGQNNPSPNKGILNALQRTVLQVPRRPTNIFVPASTPEEEVGVYNVILYPPSKTGKPALTYEQIIDVESDRMLSYMVNGDMDPLMFHQSNLRAYEKDKTLLGDVLDATIEKYASYMNLPVFSPTMDKVGERMLQRMASDEAGVQAIWTPGVSIQLRAVNKDCIVALSGVKYGKAAPKEKYSFAAGTYREYGTQVISYIALKAGGAAVTVPFTGGTLPGSTSIY